MTLPGIHSNAGARLHVVRSVTVHQILDAAVGTALGKGNYEIMHFT